MEIPWLHMVLSFSSDQIEDAIARIRDEGLGKIDTDFGDRGVKRQGAVARVKVFGALPFLDVFEQMSGYLDWNTSKDKTCACCP